MAVSEQTEDIAEKIAQVLEGEVPPELRASLELAQQAFAGDEGAVNALILSLADEKEAAPAGMTALTFGQRQADPVELARKALLKAVYGNTEALQELGRRRLNEIEREMAGPNPSPLERVLAQQAAICWMQLYHYEQRYAARMNSEPTEICGYQHEEFYQKRVARAQRRFESAVKTLAQVRRLQLPTVQVNIADKQVNVGSGQVTVGEAQVNVLPETVNGGSEED